ncbi:hypothetical protein RF11_00827 [Thelohanellus kitauei]|uniref:Retrotransposon gag domain-containing protein n=1 Tax=Thelohanellus kitauei TaxID=669202 RepID=A0A0C2JC56_THEKT|nr:hypothetical protein RF11_00827 [Thelohanellus kitauei]
MDVDTDNTYKNPDIEELLRGFQSEGFDENQKDIAFYLKRFDLTFKLHFLCFETVYEEWKRDLLMKNIGKRHLKVVLENFPGREYESIKYQQIKIYVFCKALQQGQERITDFLSRLRSLASGCQFGQHLEERLRDQFIFGLLDSDVGREIFYRFSSASVSLEEVVDVAENFEDVKFNFNMIQNIGEASSHVYKSRNSMAKQVVTNNKERSTQIRLSNNKTCVRCGENWHKNIREFQR